jgi:D-arginine dehydrogenase
MVARDDQTESLEAMLLEIGGNAGISRLSASDISLHVPILRDGYAKGAIFEETACDIDVHGLHHGYLRRLKADGGPIVTGCTVMGLSDDPGGWTIETSKGTIRAGMVVNAAGAWADEIAALAGAAPVGLMPRRRTAMIVEAHCDSYSPDWPMAADIDEDFYLKPESGRFLVSPADETLSPPCDAQPEEIDIAICIDRIETAFDLDIGAVESKWAGLRTFTADRVPVAGFDPRRPGFFWLAGQGGYGIQSAPALARFAAALALGGSSLPADIDVDPRNLDPGRFSAPPPDAANDKLQAEQANGR